MLRKEAHHEQVTHICVDTCRCPRLQKAMEGDGEKEENEMIHSTTFTIGMDAGINSMVRVSVRIRVKVRIQ